MAARDPAGFIKDHLRVEAVPGLPGIRLYAAHAGSGLARLGATPYWAYRWAGGMALAHHIAAYPDTVRGRRVLDLGAGSGLVAIAAAQAGALGVSAAEIDPYGQAAIRLTAALNGVAVEGLSGDVLAGALLEVDIVLAGDVFYDAAVAARVLPFLQRCRAADIAVLVGDPGRADLPVSRLERIAAYPLRDVGGGAEEGAVFALR